MDKPKTKTTFVPGLELCEGFYRQAVRPVLDEHFPDVAHAAALIGSGSEALGFDDAMSTDHHWGPRLMLFLREEDLSRYAEAIQRTLAERLPYTFQGNPTHYTEPDPNDNGVQQMMATDTGPVNHRVSTHTVRAYILEYLGIDIEDELEAADWLSFPEQRLLTLTGGAVYHDEVGLERERARFRYYPRDVWLYLLAAGWARIGQEEHLMGRTGWVGDEIGSALIGARLVRDVMRLCFLMERKYAPYPKWFGTAFRELSCAEELWHPLERALSADNWKRREAHLVKAYEYLAAMHNRLEITAPISEQAVSFWGRPFRVIAENGFAEAILEQVRDPEVRRIAARRPIGSIDQFSDSTDLLSYPQWRPILRKLYE